MPHTIELVEHIDVSIDVSIEFFLVIHFYPLKAVQGTGMALSFTVQPHIVTCSLFLSCSTSMASCDHFITHGPAQNITIKKTKKLNRQLKYCILFLFILHLTLLFPAMP